ncbi:MAG: helix-turn-helix domain-containing protein [Planctomycetes bacterium]|nr:helix-turn-helix domain-containing protein [Planctomycetota bacterium]
MTLLSYTLASDRELLEELGRRLRAARERQRLSAVEAAARTGLSRRTVWRAELGDNPTLLTLLRLLRLYGELEPLAALLREPELSPMAALQARQAAPRTKRRKHPAEPPRG